MARKSYDVFIKELLATAKSTGVVTMFDKIGSYQFPRYYYSGSWNRLMTAKGVYTKADYTPKGKVPFSKTSLYSVTRVVRLAEFLQDLQYAVIKGARLSHVVNYTDKVKPMFTQTNAIFDTSPIPATGITVTPAAVTGKVGGKVNLSWTIAPANSTETAVTFSTADAKIATVDAKGVVTLVAAGETNITAKVGSVSKVVKATVTA